jgi:hypothetical protein
MNVQANNTLYFKAFNEDYQRGGIYHKLDNAEFRAIVIMQSYSDNVGHIVKEDGSGYSINELKDLLGLDYRTTKKVLLVLSERGIITVGDDKVIYIHGFMDNQLTRMGNKGKGVLIKKLNEMNNKVDALAESMVKE